MTLLIAVVVFVAIVTQTLTGFGSALVAMAVLPQILFLLNDALVIASHAASRHLTSSVWQNYAVALPAIGLGILVGLSLERHINPATFRRVVLWLLIVMGLRLIVS